MPDSSSQVAHAFRGRILAGFGQDFHYALRMVRRNPGYALTAMLCLALAMGVNTTLFSLLDSMYFRGLAVPDSARVVQVHRTRTQACTFREYLDFRDRLRTLQPVAVLRFGGEAHVNGVNLLMTPETVSGNFAQVLGLGATLGRWFTAAEDSPSADPVIVLGYAFWATKLHSDPAIIGKEVRFDDLLTYRVIGVGPRHFGGVLPPVAAQAWIPIGSLVQYRGQNYGRPVNLIARLNPGFTLEQAAAEVQVLDAGLRSAEPKGPRASDPLRIEGTSGFLYMPGRKALKPVLTIMGIVCGMVLLIACVNVANLLLARAAMRQREMALRQALGAGRSRIFRASLAEGMVLAAGGLILGILFGYFTGRALELTLPGIPMPAFRGIELEIDWRVALFLAVAGSLSAILFSLPPALANSRRDLNPALNDAGVTRRSRQREIYSLAQVALSLTLLVGTGLLLRALQHVSSIDPGFAADHRLYVYLSGAPFAYKSPEATVPLFNGLLEKARALPGVTGATLSTAVFAHFNSGCAGASAAEKPRRVQSNVVEPDYFATVRIPIVQGQAFGNSGALGEPPRVLVNETLARTWWPGESALGKSVWVGCNAAKRQIGEVIGVVRDSKYIALDEESQPAFYLSRRQDPGNGSAFLTIRTAGNPYLWARQLTEIFDSAGPNLRIHETQSLDDAIALSLWEVKWQASILGSVGLLAMVLASIGLYGVVAYSVTQRTREIGVRMALGAAPGDVQWMVLGHGLRITIGGIAGGLLLSSTTVHWLQSYLYGMSPFDPVAFGIASLGWLLIAVAASWYPARRATRVDPLTALKYE